MDTQVHTRPGQGSGVRVRGVLPPVSWGPILSGTSSSAPLHPDRKLGGHAVELVRRMETGVVFIFVRSLSPPLVPEQVQMHDGNKTHGLGQFDS